MRTSMPDYASFVYSTLGIAYDSLGDSSKAIEYHTKHQVIAKEVGDRAGVVLAGNFDVDLETLLVVLQRSLVLTLAVVNISDVGVGRRHVRVVAANTRIRISRDF